MNSHISKICLGTVQFGQNYGIANQNGKVSKDEAFHILDYAQKAGIQYLDTALAYGESEIVIGDYLKRTPNTFKVISKLPSLNDFNVQEVEHSVNQSLQRMGIKKLNGYLFHKSTDVLLHDGLWDCFINLKKRGQVEKIGFSVYSPDELTALFDKRISFDIVQLPYSVFDQRFEEYFDDLKKRGIEIHARSVFLQGLPFLSLDRIPDEIQAARPQLEKLNQISKAHNISIEALCLNFVLASSDIDRVLIGVDSLTQLKSNIASINLHKEVKNLRNQLKQLKIDQEEILLPYLWKAKK